MFKPQSYLWGPTHFLSLHLQLMSKCNGSELQDMFVFVDFISRSTLNMQITSSCQTKATNMSLLPVFPLKELVYTAAPRKIRNPLCLCPLSHLTGVNIVTLGKQCQGTTVTYQAGMKWPLHTYPDSLSGLSRLPLWSSLEPHTLYAGPFDSF